MTQGTCIKWRTPLNVMYLVYSLCNVMFFFNNKTLSKYIPREALAAICGPVRVSYEYRSFSKVASSLFSTNTDGNKRKRTPVLTHN